MIPKSVKRFSEKIMLNKEEAAAAFAMSCRVARRLGRLPLLGGERICCRIDAERISRWCGALGGASGFFAHDLGNGLWRRLCGLLRNFGLGCRHWHDGRDGGNV